VLPLNNLLDKYLNEVCSFIKCKSIHNDIKEELKSHIDELSECYIVKGFSENDALSRAIAEMGSSADVGRKINDQHKPQTNWTMILLTSIIAIIGIAIMYVSSNFEGHHAVNFERHLFFVVIGFCLLGTMYFFDYSKLKKYPYHFLVFGFLVFILTLFSGTYVNGSIRYFRIGSLYLPSIISSSGLICLSSIIGFSGLIDRYKASGGIGILKLIIIGGMTFIPLVMFPDISTAFVLLLSYAVILLVAVTRGNFGGNKKVQILSLVGIGVLFVLIPITIMIVTSPYRLQRIISFFEGGYNDPQGYGWVMVMADKLLAASNWVGEANPIAEGTVSNVMPGLTSEYVLLNIITHFGIIAGIVLIGVVALLIVKMFVTSSKIKNDFGFYISMMASTYLAAQFILNILMNFNLVPSSSYTLPFVSYGGSAFIVNMIFVGIILSVWRRNNIITKDKGFPMNKVNKFLKIEDGKVILDFRARTR